MSETQVKFNDEIKEVLKKSAEIMIHDNLNFSKVPLPWQGGSLFLVKGDTPEYEARKQDRGAILPLATIEVGESIFFIARR